MYAIAGSLPKCCGFIILSASVISPSVVKIGRWLYMRNANKYRKIPYSAMVREVKKWSGIRIQDRTSTKNADMEQSATRDSGLLLTSNIPKGDQVSPFSSVIQLSWRCPRWRSADVCIELCNSLDVVFVKFPLQLCDGSTIIHDICSSISSSTIGRPNHNTKL